MQKTPKRSPRASRRRASAIANVMAMGALLVLVPLFLGKSPIGKAIAPMSTLGWLLLVGGGIALLLNSTPDKEGEAQRSNTTGNQGPARPLTTPSVTTPPPAAVAAINNHQTARPTAWGPEVFSVIEWRRFEAVVEALFAQAGFETKSQSHGADGGVDVWLYSRSSPGHPVSLVQCKHWQGKRVGVDKIRELRGVMAAHQVRRGQFATTSTFTEDAQAFARGNQINLLDVAALLDLIAKRTTDQQQALLEVAIEGEYWRPTCVNCNKKMVERTPRAGGSQFWGCVAYPRCKKTLPMRST